MYLAHYNFTLLVGGFKGLAGYSGMITVGLSVVL